MPHPVGHCYADIYPRIIFWQNDLVKSRMNFLIQHGLMDHNKMVRSIHNVINK